MSSTDSTIKFAAATAAGRGAVATTIVFGDGALQCIDKLFRPVSKIPFIDHGFDKVVYGHWLSNGQPGEDLVVVAKNSDHVEIHCHGGEIAIRMIGKSLCDHGANQSDQNELATFVFGNDYHADLQLTLSRAPTQRTAKFVMAQKQVQQRFFKELRNAFDRGELSEAEKTIDRCLAWEQFGRQLTTPWKIALCGKPNVGKSSLINSLVGFQRAIVHPSAGTTRDVLTESTAIDGWPVELFDTAGIRNSNDSIEKMGIERARQTVADADVVALVVDSSCVSQLEIGSQVAELKPDLVIANKSDLRLVDFAGVSISVSAKTGLGMEPLLELLSKTIVPELPGDDAAVPVSSFQVKLFRGLRSDEGRSGTAHALLGQI